MTAGALRNRSRSAAFLMYHSINDQGPRWLTVTPDLFERQLHTLGRNGFTTGGVDELGALAEGRRPSRPVAFLTFDDGYRDNYTEALPLLRAAGATALIFIMPPKVDGGAALDWPEVAQHVSAHPDVMRSLDWGMVEEMADAGIQFGSHGLSHSSLPSLEPDQLREELLDSRRRIIERIGRCDVFAYPFGRWDGRVAAAVADAGYRFGLTIPDRPQPRVTPHLIPRVAVDYRDAPLRFSLKLSGTGRRLWLSPARRSLRNAGSATSAVRAAGARRAARGVTL